LSSIMKVSRSHRFKKQWAKARHTEFAPVIKRLVDIILKNPFQTPPPYEKLRGYPNAYSRRINEQHRLVYIVKGDTIELDRCWGHYGAL